MSSAIHCLKCKTKTANGSIALHKTQKGGSMIKTTCKNCGAKKCRFVKGDGFFDDVWSGIKSAANTVAPYAEAVAPAIPYVGPAVQVGKLIKRQF